MPRNPRVAERHGPRRPRDLQDVLPMGQPAGVDRGHQGFEIGLPGQLGIQGLQPLRGSQQQRRRVATAPQGKRDLRPHPLHVRKAELA